MAHPDFCSIRANALDIAHLLQLDSEQSDGYLSMIGCLLELTCWGLKKNVYNAYGLPFYHQLLA
jgi:hypothetical protein